MKYYIFFIFSTISLVVQAQTEQFPWIKYIDPENKREDILQLYSKADVSVSDNSTYTAETYFRDSQHSVFNLVYPDKKSLNIVDGLSVLTFDDESVQELDANMSSIIFGHQFHYTLLFPESIHGQVQDSGRKEINGKNMDYHLFEDGWEILVGKNEQSIILRNTAFSINVKFKNFDTINSFYLPMTIVIDDGKRVFDYNYQDLSFEHKEFDQFRPSFSMLDDEQKILRLHRIAMDNHLDEETKGINSAFGEEFTVLYDGEIIINDRKAASDQIERIMSSRDHYEYNDLEKPIIKVSKDGTLGWLMAKVEAKGVRLDEDGMVSGPLEFRCSWIMLYEKIDNEWQVVGNVSTFEPNSN